MKSKKTRSKRQKTQRAIKTQNPIPGERLSTFPGCPSCGKILDGYINSKLNHRSPKPNDVSICGYCGEILIFFGEPLSLRKPTETELIEIEKDDEFTRLHQRLLIELAKRPKH